MARARTTATAAGATHHRNGEGSRPNRGVKTPVMSANDDNQRKGEGDQIVQLDGEG